jgi:hypothetical protein
MTTNPSTAIVVYDPERADPEHIALAGFLGGYRGLTRDAYALDLRQFFAFCDEHQLDLFDVRRSNIETYARKLEARGKATATVARRLCTVTGFYRYAEEEGLIAHSPAVHTSVVLGSTTSLMPLASTETRWEHSSSRQDSGLQVSMRWYHCWR